METRRRLVSLMLTTLVLIFLTSWLFLTPMMRHQRPLYTDVIRRLWSGATTKNGSTAVPPEVVTTDFRSELSVVQTKLGMPVEFLHGVPVLVWMFWGSANLTGNRGESALLSSFHVYLRGSIQP